ncbi:hypothetical protein ACJMK2_011160 [Sinanodonta woodiana]|uniref:SANT and BTB domain-containing protein n=2 Tax=Sinanodonta woodiana TaxID=1069815 RepID=A0ABD3V723_SINWO
MASVEPQMRTLVALDLILKSLITSHDFQELTNKNWEAIARLIPGTTAGMVARRYEELLLNGEMFAFDHFEKNFGSSSGNLPISMSDPNLVAKSSLSRPDSGKGKGTRDDKDGIGGRDATAGKGYKDHGPVMVIHVCDEAKSLKQDFQCPRDLLVREMKYFAEYLSTDAQRWEEVDISVHCDVQIFDWLMKYVKRGTKEVSEKPRLEPNNVISILISSDFLKMDSLVQECIEYCHGNMSAIVATPCNMNCINDKLVGRISDLFTHNEADDIKDRKDKFKSKLFAKKIERLFEVDFNNPDSPENCSTLYRCSVCKKLLTKILERKVKCSTSRMTIDKRGNLIYCHVRDPSFDVNEYLLDLKSQLKNWRDVYWRLWGTVNYLTCSRCGETFMCNEYGHCKFHPEPPRYENSSNYASYIGTYPCCHQKTLRFDPTQQNKGCRVRDHVVNMISLNPENDNESEDLPPNKVYEDLLAHRDAVCVSYQRLTDASEQELNVFSNEEFASSSRGVGVAIGSIMSISEEDSKTEQTFRHQPRLQALTVEKEFSFEYDDVGMGESDDEIGDDEQPKAGRKTRGTKKSCVTIDPQAILMDAPDFEQTKKSTWDVGRSLRYNQDAQRQEDLRRMREIQMYLTKLRLNADKVEKPRKEYAGGVFSRLEIQWKAAYLQHQAKQQAQQQQFRKRDRQNNVISTFSEEGTR